MDLTMLKNIMQKKIQKDLLWMRLLICDYFIMSPIRKYHQTKKYYNFKKYRKKSQGGKLKE